MTDPIEPTSPHKGAGATALPARERRPLFGTVVWGLALLADQEQ